MVVHRVDEVTAEGPEQGSFECHRCGTCCTSLRGIWSDEETPLGSMAGERIYRLPTPGGLRIFAWEAGPFDPGRLDPLLVVADGRRERLVALAYELDARTCPQYDEDVGCTIYEDRPLVCRAYPLLVVSGERGPEVTVSGLCPGRVAVAERAREADRPEPVLAEAYPDAFAPALAVPATVNALTDVVAFLESADVVEPLRGLDAETIAAWRERGAVDLVDVVEGAGVLDRDALAGRASAITERIRERWT